MRVACIRATALGPAVAWAATLDPLASGETPSPDAGSGPFRCPETSHPQTEEPEP